ncbi:hypothetical protein SA8601_1094 [Staphylococcus aureus subsp. aureus SA8601]|uniref:Uncharacterized protein n=1 Tax=Staphylococcus aureus subsp. aureus ST228 TaxID=1074919 RepID=A0A7U7EZ38_STAAU|nr:hypothetical protein SA2981_1625 [Staphylococcus aureus 04-02981]AGO30012.1 hypothetical protein CA347_1659 [Staphylococcus aureus CA-347]AWE58034.1 hypothetical protein CSC50_1960 [Staphylococcus aureus]EHT18245.1 hypothetical protein SACIG1057_2563 [Staphylococcus aureus subsp. aureus CIG1057]EHT38204.1 hypothetical protein SACIG1769_2192 [Staphylococcus aureus subsp. aureus CIG1769]EHT48542.1 hypothetical protein SACIG1150_2159 [Staphylococcus aureus subsp. aureus CIG1150]EHT79315.1 hyp
MTSICVSAPGITLKIAVSVLIRAIFLKINAITIAINNIEIDTTIIESQLFLISITTFFVNVDPICTPNSTIPNSLSKNGHLISSLKTFTQMIDAIIGPNINGSNTCDEYNIILIKNDKTNTMKLFLYIIVMFSTSFNKK